MLTVGIILYVVIALVIWVIWVRSENKWVDENLDTYFKLLTGLNTKTIARRKFLPSLFWPITAIYQIIYLIFWE